MGKKQRIRELEARVAELEQRLGELQAIVEAQRAMMDAPCVPNPPWPYTPYPDPIIWQHYEPDTRGYIRFDDCGTDGTIIGVITAS